MRKLVLVSAALVLVLAGCKGGSSGSSTDSSPGGRLAAAKRSLDAAQFIGFTLKTGQLPDGLQGLLSASGTGTHDPAFTGEVKVQTSLTDITAPLIAVNGTVYAKFPFVGWNTLNPADYGAPDPSSLMDTKAGISSLFTATQHPTTGDSQRDGAEVLTSIQGTLPGDTVKQVFPSSGSADFAVTYTLTSADDIHSATITGPFYSGHADVTYTIDFNLRAGAVDIVAPSG